MARTKTGKRSNNEGSIIQLKNGRWRAIVSLGLKEDGTRHRISEVFDTYADANKWRLEKITVSQQYGQESAKEIVGMFVPSYHRWLLEIKKESVQPTQFKVLMRHYTNYIKPFFLNRKQKDLKGSSFRKFFEYLEEKKVGVETRRKVYQSLHQYFEYIYQDTPMRNPMDHVAYMSRKKQTYTVPQIPELESSYKAVPKELRERFFQALDVETHSRFIKPLCYIMYFSGNRIGEVLALQWKDFNFERRYYYIYKSVAKHYDFDENGEVVGVGKSIVKGPKTLKGIRPLPLIDVVYEVMIEWREVCKAAEILTGISFTAPHDYVFANKFGERRTEDGTETIFRRFLVRHHLDHQGIHFQALRQTFSNTLFATENDEDVITDVMGHTDISTTKKHYKSIEKFDSVQKVAKKLNELFKPKNDKYRADESVTYAPDGYLTELEALVTGQNKPEIGSEIPPKRSLNDLLAELATYPEFMMLMQKAQGL